MTTPTDAALYGARAQTMMDKFRQEFDVEPNDTRTVFAYHVGFPRRATGLLDVEEIYAIETDDEDHTSVYFLARFPIGTLILKRGWTSNKIDLDAHFVDCPRRFLTVAARVVGRSLGYKPHQACVCGRCES